MTTPPEREAARHAARRGLAVLLLIIGSIVVVAIAAVLLPWPVGLVTIAGAGMVGAGAAMFKRQGGTSA